jgi:hypothetical protein
VSIIRKLLARWQSQREALAYAEAYHSESRARIEQLAAKGRSAEALRENLALIGIDTSKTERPRLASVGGIRL